MLLLLLCVARATEARHDPLAPVSPCSAVYLVFVSK